MTETRTVTEPQTAQATGSDVDGWIGLPAADAPDLAQWAHQASVDAVADRGLPEELQPRLAAMLLALAEECDEPLADWRVLHLVHPLLGAVLWNIRFAAPMPVEGLRRVLGYDQPGPEGMEVGDFEHRGLRGAVCLRFARAASEPGGESPLIGTASVGLVRALGGVEQSVVAWCVSGSLEPLLSSIRPMQRLLASAELEELTAT